MLKRQGWIAWYRVKAPDLFASGRVIGGHVAANAEFGATVADKDFALGGLGRAGDRIEAVSVYDRVDFPDFLAVLAFTATRRPSNVAT